MTSSARDASWAAISPSGSSSTEPVNLVFSARGPSGPAPPEPGAPPRRPGEGTGAGPAALDAARAVAPPAVLPAAAAAAEAPPEPGDPPASAASRARAFAAASSRSRCARARAGATRTVSSVMGGASSWGGTRRSMKSPRSASYPEARANPPLSQPMSSMAEARAARKTRSSRRRGM